MTDLKEQYIMMDILRCLAVINKGRVSEDISYNLLLLGLGHPLNLQI